MKSDIRFWHHHIPRLQVTGNFPDLLELSGVEVDIGSIVVSQGIGRVHFDGLLIVPHGIGTVIHELEIRRGGQPHQHDYNELKRRSGQAVLPLHCYVLM